MNSLFFYLLLSISIACVSACPKNSPQENGNTEKKEKKNESIKKGFAYKTLKEWTQHVLKFSESGKASAVNTDVFNPSEKIELLELETALLHFTKKMSAGKIAESSAWLDSVVPPDAFFHNTPLTEKASDDERLKENVYFAQRIFVEANSRIVVMGDFHGSLHSLIRNLWRLQQSGYLTNEFLIARPNTHFVFTGDFIDRGRYSAEVLYTLLRLKLANFETVHLLRGNHEGMQISSKFGFLKELEAKYGKEEGRKQFFNVHAAMRYFPVVLFASIGSREKNYNIHFSHGGFSYHKASEKFVHEPKFLLNAAKNIQFELLSTPNQLGYQWTDFHQRESSVHNSARGFDASEPVVVAGLKLTKKYMTRNNISLIIRGHQDRAFGLKMLYPSVPSHAILSVLARLNSVYPNGPYYWKHVVDKKDIRSTVPTQFIALNRYGPVYTLTTASEGQGLPFDAYGIIHCGTEFHDAQLELHETAISQFGSDAFFVTIDYAREASDDGIHVSRSPNGPGDCLIDLER